uniref:Uncharacterized protein n=1 Tax=Timema bartmani TaxID=61472 RepID=A0A7R9F4D2_9NEOP|nr:unnamed protein product [Timema bartmani]
MKPPKQETENDGEVKALNPAGCDESGFSQMEWFLTLPPRKYGQGEEIERTSNSLAAGNHCSHSTLNGRPDSILLQAPTLTSDANTLQDVMGGVPDTMDFSDGHNQVK